MSSSPAQPAHRSWTKDQGQYIISTDPEKVPIPSLNKAFASDFMYWATPLNEDMMRIMLRNSLCFGLYDQQAVDGSTGSTPAFIGFARCVTDFATMMYLTDVFVDPSYQGKGLGTWLVGCVQEVIESMPHVRRSVVLTGDWEKLVPFYEKVMGVSVHESTRGEGMAVMMRGYGMHGDPNLFKHKTTAGKADESRSEGED